MSVSSGSSRLSVSLLASTEEIYPQLSQIWQNSGESMSHSRTPLGVKYATESRNAQIVCIYEGDELIAYIPIEIYKFFGISIIRPAYYELTLDFIDIEALKGKYKLAAQAFLEWVKQQPSVVLDFFMCSENALLAKTASDDPQFLVIARGTYLASELPESFEKFLATLSRSTRQDSRRTLRTYEDNLRFDVVESPSTEEEFNDALDNLFRLHKVVFPTASTMLIHKSNLTKYFHEAFNDGAIVFSQARNKSNNEVVATNVYARSKGSLGLINNGRQTEPEYAKVGSWVLLKSIEWAIDNNIHRFEYFFGDQEYKRRLSCSSADAVSINYFSSSRARYLFRIRQRLGRRFSFLR